MLFKFSSPTLKNHWYCKKHLNQFFLGKKRERKKKTWSVIFERWNYGVPVFRIYPFKKCHLDVATMRFLSFFAPSLQISHFAELVPIGMHRMNPVPESSCILRVEEARNICDKFLEFRAFLWKLAGSLFVSGRNTWSDQDWKDAFCKRSRLEN